MAIILFEEKKMSKSWCQPFNLGAHHYFDFKGHGSWVKFLAESCFVCLLQLLFVCLFVFFNSLGGWLFCFLSLTSGWGFLVFVLFCFFCFFFFFVLFCFCFVLSFLQNAQFPHHNLGSGWFFFFFCLAGW